MGAKLSVETFGEKPVTLSFLLLKKINKFHVETHFKQPCFPYLSMVNGSVNFIPKYGKTNERISQNSSPPTSGGADFAASSCCSLAFDSEDEKNVAVRRFPWPGTPKSWLVYNGLEGKIPSVNG